MTPHDPTASEVLISIGRWITGIGFPALLAVFGRQQWRNRTTRKVDEVKANVEEATAPDRIASSSISTVEARMVAVARAWDLERISLQGTIDHQAKQLVDERAYSASRDELINELRAKVEDLQNQLTEVAHRLEGL